MKYISGYIYKDEEFEEGFLGFEDGVIKETGKGKKDDVIAKGIIIPPLANPHIHIADAVFQDEIKGSIEEVVAPPLGLKHRILKETSRETIIKTIKSTADLMFCSGIGYFGDFREGGVEGVRIVKEALSDSPLNYKLFGRPKEMKYDKKELNELLLLADGIGLSAVSDWEEDEIKKISAHTKRAGKKFALHASERIREDLDFVLDLKPDFLVHMTEATDEDLKICAENEIPIIVCPRSEMFFGHMPDIPRMLRKNVTLTLGSDNAMINKPHSFFREMEFAYKISKSKGEIKAKDILNMVLKNSRKVLNVSDDICLSSGKDANFIVLNLLAKNPAYALVNGAGSRDISVISTNKYLWIKK